MVRVAGGLRPCTTMVSLRLCAFVAGWRFGAFVCADAPMVQPAVEVAAASPNIALARPLHIRQRRRRAVLGASAAWRAICPLMPEPAWGRFRPAFLRLGETSFGHN